MVQRFSQKLDQLAETVGKLKECQSSGVKTALASSSSKHVIAVGSGGSAVSVEFFSLCRETLSHGPTSIQTPMKFVMGYANISKSDVWIFSASGKNPDVIAAVEAAITRNSAMLNIVTCAPESLAAQLVSGAGGAVHVVGVADYKDGFLATHSLVGTIGLLLVAFDSISGDSIGEDVFLEFNRQVSELLSPDAREKIHMMFSVVRPEDVLVLVSDPQVSAISTLIETSLWETSLCPVQVTDFRNFSHGRHTWLHHHGDRTVVLALTGVESRSVWEPIAALLPSSQRVHCLDFGDCGRLSNAIGVVAGLVVVEALGRSLDIDPGKPVIGSFGKLMYEESALRHSARFLTPAVRQKRSAIARRDHSATEEAVLSDIESERLKQLTNTTFGGIVLDYDGTIVTTDDRYASPSSQIISELERLHKAGLLIGIATGRGGSAGENLRSVLDPILHPAVLVGYYNGGYLRTLDVDITKYPAPEDSAIAEAVDWLRSQPHIVRDGSFRNSGVQITISLDQLERPEQVEIDLAVCPPVAAGKLSIARSGHSLDLITSKSSKLNVVEAMQYKLGGSEKILCVGDSGSVDGNDYALLAHPYGVSVGNVCASPAGVWSLFGERVKGPLALLKVLRALITSPSGGIVFNVSSLNSD